MSWARALLTNGRVLAILDGFDEIAEEMREGALRDLTAIELPLLLTSRPAELEAARRGRPLFPGIELTDLELQDYADYFTIAEDAWRCVLGKLRDDPDAPAHERLAAVLRTPLMATMAVACCEPGGSTPQNLVEPGRFDSREALERHLLDSFVAAAYSPDRNRDPDIPRRRRWNAEQGTRWLGYLATHLTETGTPDIEWWKLGTAMSLPARMLVSGTACGLVSGTAVTLVHAVMTDPPAALLTMFLNVLGIGLAFGLLHGFASKLEVGGAFRPSRMRIRVSGEPKGTRSRRVRESLRPRVRGGLAGGLVFGAVFGCGAALYAVLMGHPWTLAALLLGNWLVAGPLIGLAVGTVLALVTWLEADPGPEHSVSPAELLRTNRTIVLVQVSAVGLVLGLGYGTVVTYFNGFALGLPTGIGAGLAVAFGVGTLTAWGRWAVLVRIWLPLTGRLPRAVNTFLDDARDRGVLRQSGAVHQFRHAALESHVSHLATQTADESR